MITHTSRISFAPRLGYATCLALFSTPDRFSLCCRSERGHWIISMRACTNHGPFLLTFFSVLAPCPSMLITPWWQMFQNQHIGPRSVQEYSTFSPLACYKTRRLWTEPTVRSEGQPAQGIPKVLWKRSSIPKKDLDPLESFLVAF